MSEIRTSRNQPYSGLTVTPIPAFQDNYFWLLARGGCATVVDPGTAQPVLDTLSQYGLVLDTILLTHHHADHTGGVARLVEVTGASVFAPRDERINHVEQHVADDDQVRIETLGIEFRVMATPGHTLSHIAYHAPGLLFCGDTLFSLGCGRLFEGSPAQMLASLDRIAALPNDTLVFCAHEYTLDNARFALAVDPNNPALIQRVQQAQQQRAAGEPTLPALLDSEKAANPFLRSDSEAIRIGMRDRLVDEADRIACFAALRYWKDEFRG